MGQIIIRNLDDDVKARLKERAGRHGRSMEEEVRQILRNSLKGDGQPVARLGSRIAVRFSGVGLDEELPEFHGQAIKPMDLVG